jgi:hypothetical protein
MNTAIYFLKFGITTHDPYVSVEVAWVAQWEPTPSRVSFNRFPRFTSSCFNPCGGEADLGALGRHLAIYEATPPRVTNAIKIASQSLSDQITHKEESLNPNLELSQITQTS